jgi:hypothetical protein
MTALNVSCGGGMLGCGEPRAAAEQRGHRCTEHAHGSLLIVRAPTRHVTFNVPTVAQRPVLACGPPDRYCASFHLRVRNPQMTNVIEHRVATAVCRIILHGVVIIHGIFNCKIIDDHRTAGTRRVPCRNTRSVTHAAATRLDHTRLKGSLACGERPHTPGQQTWGRTLCASLGRCFPFEMTCTGRSFGALWSSFRSGRRGRGWI